MQLRLATWPEVEAYLARSTDVFVFDVDDADGDGGVLYYDADTSVAGYTVVATLDSGTVTAADIVLV